ncbi:hypothetical protein SK128_018425 [Halocaridina rubra]|uniref:Uncharacterized protein n=1 Tax=Halocaridina rubra TaxID=373956 RepID=A0AAN8XRE9_HALRR
MRILREQPNEKGGSTLAIGSLRVALLLFIISRAFILTLVCFLAPSSSFAMTISTPAECNNKAYCILPDPFMYGDVSSQNPISNGSLTGRAKFWFTAEEEGGLLSGQYFWACDGNSLLIQCPSGYFISTLRDFYNNNDYQMNNEQIIILICDITFGGFRVDGQSTVYPKHGALAGCANKRLCQKKFTLTDDLILSGYGIKAFHWEDPQKEHNSSLFLANHSYLIMASVNTVMTAQCADTGKRFQVQYGNSAQTVTRVCEGRYWSSDWFPHCFGGMLTFSRP